MCPSASMIGSSATCSPSVRSHDMSRARAGRLAVDDDRHTVDDRGVHADGPCLEPTCTTRQVAHELLATRVDRVGVEEEHVGPLADLDGAAIGEAEERRRELRDLADAF